MKRTVIRICLGTTALLVVVAAIALVDFLRWRSGIVEGIETDARRRVVETARGPIEVAVEGEGVPMLVLHGSIGGYDSALQFGGQVRGVQLVAVSRPGYLGTPLSSGATHEEQADLYAALLDELGIDKALVFAGSAGGPFGMQFALRHPDRTLGLILVSTGLESHEDDIPDLGPAMLFIGDMYMWASARFFPSLLMGNIAANFDAGDPEQAARARALAETLAPMGRRWAGNLNDGAQLANPALNDWPVENNTVPTLVIHGDQDQLASYENAVTMAGRIANAELITITGGGHAGFSGRQGEIFAAAVGTFIQALNGGTP